MAIITAFITGATCAHYVHALFAGGGIAMVHDPLDDVYSFVERAYVRLQAGDVLIRCMEEGNPAPIHQMVEGLVLAGPQSINILREIMSETSQRKHQVVDDLNQLFSDLERSLKGYGVYLNDAKVYPTLPHLTPVRFLAVLREQGITEEKVQKDCLKILRNSRELIASLSDQVKLLDDIEIYLKDWIWGLAYQITRQEADSKNL
jgi:hypothetical protein